MGIPALAMLSRVLSLFRPPQPAGSQQILRSFSGDDRPIDAVAMTVEEGGWRIDVSGPRTVHLFEIPDPSIEQCMLVYRARMRSESLAGKAYLEMWCRFPGQGEFFSKGLNQTVRGTTGWAAYETPFYLKKGQRPDLLKLNLVLEGAGTVWIKDVEVLQTPLKG
jgi:hypothetical protein